MAEPITWRTVAGNALENAWRPMQGAVTTIDTGFDRLMKMIEGRQEVNQGVADRAREANVQTLLDKYQSAATPEQLAQMQASGELDPLKAAIDPRDAARVRGADEARLTAVRTLQQAGRKAAEDDFLFKNQGLIAQAQAKAAQGDMAGAMELAKPLVDHPIYGEVVAKAVQGDRDVRKFNDTLENSKSTRQRQADETRIGDAQVAVSQRQAATQEGQLAISRLDHAIQQQQRDREQLTKEGANTIGGPGAFDALTADIQKSSEDKTQTAKLTGLVSNALSSNPKYASLPSDVVKAIALKQLPYVGHGFWNMLDPRTDMNSTVLDALKTDLDKALIDPTVAGRIDASKAQKTQLQEQLKLYTPVLDEARRAVFPQTQAQIDAAAARAAAGPQPAPAAADSTANARDLILGRGGPAEAAAPAATSALDQALLKRRAAAEQQALDAGVIKDFSPDVKAYLTQQAGEQAKTDAAQQVETRKRADAIFAQQRDEFRRRQEQLAGGTTGNDVGIMRLEARAAAARQALADASKKAR